MSSANGKGVPAVAAAAGEGEGLVGASTGLEGQQCVPCHSKTLEPLPLQEARALLQQELPSWEIVEVEGVPRLRRAWKTRNFLAGLGLFQRISAIAEAQGHHPDLHLEGWNNARVEIFTHSIGGLHKNDFILAAKISALDVEDLLRKPKKSLA